MKLRPAISVGAVACLVLLCSLLDSCGGGGMGAGTSQTTPTLTQISLAPANQNMANGTTLQLTATGVYSDGTQKNLSSSVTWQVKPASVATISGQGDLAAVGQGVAQVSAIYESVTGTTSVTVGAAALASITINAPQIALPLGESEQLTVTGSYTDGSSQNLTQAVTWQVTPATVLTINSQGSLITLSSGTAEISAEYSGITATSSITIGPAALVSISVSVPRSSLPLGESEQLAATGNFTDGTTQNLTQAAVWQTNSPGVATVSSTGDLKGVTTGNTQVSATSQGVSGSASVTVGSPALLSVAINVPQSSLPSGESEQLTATGTLSDGSMQNLSTLVSWQVTPPDLATISAQGSLQGTATGIAQVSATYKGITGTTSVTIGSATLLRIAVNATQSSLPVGESEQLTATGTLSDGTTQSLTSVVTWQVSSSTIAAINAQGTLQGLSAGVARISASYQGITGTNSVVIAAAALLQIAVSIPQASLPLGESEQVMATGTFSDGTMQNVTPSVNWSSSDPTIASITPAGVVSGAITGSAVLTASVGNITGFGNLTITPAVVMSLSLSPSQLSLVIGNAVQLQATATYSDGTTQDVTGSVTWSSDPAAISDVNSSGLLTGDQVGSATIVAVISGISGSASLTVTPLMTVSYFSRVNSVNSGIDATLQIVNPGFPQGELCAMVYVFDQNQELSECCGCNISDNGLLTLSAMHDLTANPLTGNQPAAGMVAVVPATPSANNQCNAGNPNPNGEILGWETTVQGSSGTYQITETPSSMVPLSDTEAQVLALDCAAVQQLGGSAGSCSCGTGN